MAEPIFDNLLRVLNREEPTRPTLFEFFLNEPLYRRLVGPSYVEKGDGSDWSGLTIQAFAAAGYDYATLAASDFCFPAGEHRQDRSRSMNEGSVIRDGASFQAYPWKNPDDFDYSRLETLAPEVPAGMKLVVYGPGGVLENVVELVGYEALCLLIADDPELAQAVFDAVGSRLVRHYEIVGQYPIVGAMISNDDWGHKTQTMLRPADMRRYVFSWHARIVEAIHKSGRPAILHSCGARHEVMEDIIEVMSYDGVHSFEDAIEPVEEAYERWGRRVAILGGIDVDFICRSTPEQVYQRSKAMLRRSAGRGSYALGSGNSIPEYVPQEGYLAMIRAATEARSMVDGQWSMVDGRWVKADG